MIWILLKKWISKLNSDVTARVWHSFCSFEYEEVFNCSKICHWLVDVARVAPRNTSSATCLLYREVIKASHVWFRSQSQVWKREVLSNCLKNCVACWRPCRVRNNFLQSTTLNVYSSNLLYKILFEFIFNDMQINWKQCRIL